MRYLTSVLFCFILLGCSGQQMSDGGFLVVEKKDGVVVKNYKISAQPIDNFRDYTVEAKNGKLTWSVTLKNDGKKRAYATGIITVYTNVNAVVFIEFGSTVDPKDAKDATKTGEIVVGEKDAVVEGMPKDWLCTKDSCMIVPGAGCETSYGVAGNWPVTPFWKKYRAEFTKINKDALSEVHLFGKLVGDVKKPGLDEYVWKQEIKNPFDKKCRCTVSVSLVTSEGEKQTKTEVGDVPAKGTAWIGGTVKLDKPLLKNLSEVSASTKLESAELVR